MEFAASSEDIARTCHAHPTAPRPCARPPRGSRAGPCSMSLEVRPARSGELQTCAEIYERAARATFTWFDLENLQERFLADAEEEEVHVAVEDGACWASRPLPARQLPSPLHR